MPYYDDEMTDRAVKAWITWAKKRYGTFAQQNRYETFRHGNTINIGRYDGRPTARYRVIQLSDGSEKVRRLSG